MTEDALDALAAKLHAVPDGPPWLAYLDHRAPDLSEEIRQRIARARKKWETGGQGG